MSDRADRALTLHELTELTERTGLPKSTVHALSASTGLAVQMAILDGTDDVYLERIPMRGFAPPTRQGGRQPAYCKQTTDDHGPPGGGAAP